MIEALTASGPVAEHAEQLHLGWVLEGRAVQDVLLSPPRDQRLRPDAPAGEYGTTIRFHDPRIDVWRASWAAPVGARVYTLIARATGEGIVVEGLGPDGGGRTWFTDERMRMRRRISA